MPFAEINGNRHYYEIHGTGPVVVLAHGAGGNHISWWQQIAALSTEFCVLVFDHRGFGLSERGQSSLGPDVFVDDLDQLLTHLGIDRAAVVGQSMGGLTAGGFAARFPDRAWGVVFCSSMGGLRPRGEFPSPSRLYADLKLEPDETVGHSIPVARLEHALGADLIERQPEMVVLYEAIAGINQIPFSELLPEFVAFRIDPEPLVRHEIPVLFLTGENDVLMPPPLVQNVAGQIPHARFSAISGSGHSTYFENPDEFNRTVLEFLTSGGALNDD